MHAAGCVALSSSLTAVTCGQPFVVWTAQHLTSERSLPVTRRWFALVPLIALLGLAIASLPGSVLGAAEPFLSSSLDAVDQAAQSSIYLPAISRAHRVLPAGAIFDDFSDPSSGWPIADEEEYSSGYVDGEYRFFVKGADTGGYSFHPTFRCVDCDISVDVRIASDAHGIYGLSFGVTEAQDAAYLFGIGFDEAGERGYFELWKAIGDLPDDPLWTRASEHIRSSKNTNTLRVRRIGTDIHLYVNGQYLENIPDDELVGLFGVGVAAGSEDTPGVDIRFDNFYAVPLN
jgi:hypothetical protein